MVSMNVPLPLLSLLKLNCTGDVSCAVIVSDIKNPIINKNLYLTI